MNVLFALDHLSEVKAATQLLKAFTWPDEPTLYVLHVLDEELISESERQEGKQIERKQRPELRTRPMVFPAHIPSRAELEAQAKSLLDDAVQELRTELKFRIEPVFRTGVPGSEILQAIRDLSIDLIAIGTRKHTLREIFQLGSVSDWILDEAPCPVLVLRANEQRNMTGETFTIVLAIDGSSDAWTAVELLKQLGLPPHTHITVLHVIKQHLPDGPLRFSTCDRSHDDFVETVETQFGQRGRQAIDLLERAASTFRDADHRVELELAFGHEAEEILKTVKTLHPHLLAIGSRGLTGLRRALMGGVSSRVVRHAPCTVLVAR